MTSSTEPEVHNILHCRRRMTEPRPCLTRTENFVKFRYVVFEIRERRDRHRPTHRQIDGHPGRSSSQPPPPGGGRSSIARACKQLSVSVHNRFNVTPSVPLDSSARRQSLRGTDGETFCSKTVLLIDVFFLYLNVWYYYGRPM